MSLKTRVTRIMSLLVVSGVCLVASVQPVLAAEPVSSKLKQNLDIMQDILEKSLRTPTGRGSSDIDVSYIAGQGVLFETRIDGDINSWMFSGGPMPGMDPALMARISAEAARVSQAAFSGSEIDESALEQLTAQAEAAAEQFSEQQERASDQLRDMREQKRDVERELRDVEREKRDIEFAQKVSKLDAGQQKQLDALVQKQQQLQSKLNTLQQQYTLADADFRKKQDEKKKLAEQQQAELIKKVGINMAQTLCDYGAGLRELADKQFVALKLKTHGRNSADVYWVFTKSDINSCVAGKTNADTLLKKASYYTY